jgi:hypothetical protein
MKRPTAKRKMPKAKIIGDRTQNHDHAMNPVSFRAMNNSVKPPKNPIPPLAEEELTLLDIIFLIN